MDDYSQEDLRELMSEPPGGLNHGRKRSGAGWRRLDAPDEKFRSPVEDSAKAGPRRHGTTYTYVKIGCRCEDCRRAWATYIRNRRVP